MYPETDKTVDEEDRNCLVAVTDDAGSLQAKAMDCYTKGVGSVCERRFENDMRHCDFGWFLYEGKCLHAEAYRGTYEESKKYCKLMGGSLAAPQDEGIYVSIGYLLHTSFGC